MNARSLKRVREALTATEKVAWKLDVKGCNGWIHRKDVTPEESLFVQNLKNHGE